MGAKKRLMTADLKFETWKAQNDADVEEWLERRELWLLIKQGIVRFIDFVDETTELVDKKQ